MEKALVSAATGVLNPVIGKLSSLLENEYTLFTGVRHEVTSLKTELQHMKAALESLSGVEDPGVQNKLWMTELRELSYDIEDSVDEFLLRIDTEPTKLKGFKGFMKRISNFFSKIKTRCRIAHEVKGLKVLVKEAGDRRPRYMIDPNIRQPSEKGNVDSRVCSLYKPKSEIVGTDGPKLISKLTEGNEVQKQQLKIVPIVGCGGLGKTTLANQVYGTYGESFVYRAFVSISQNPNMTEILRSIYSQVTKPRFSHPKDTQAFSNISELANSIGLPLPGFAPEELGRVTDVQQLMDHISGFLKDKRYLIVVDDLWNIREWEIINCVFPESNCGSRIITTTRKYEVAEACCFPHRGFIYELETLSDADSKSLFLRRIFGPKEQCPSHLEHHCSTILRKCGGVPLAICAVSGLLASKLRTEDIWNRVQNSISNAPGRHDHGVIQMFSILSLSYFDLPHHLKSCLLYLSIFPENYTIEKKSLVKRWIAEGFIPEEEGSPTYEFGERCFNELINRSLIQPTKTNIFGEVKAFQVHDMILEFIVSKSLEENFVTVLGAPNRTSGHQKKVRRLSLRDSNQEHGVPFTGLIFSHARSLTVFGNLSKLPSLLEFRIIRLLDLENCDLSEYLHCLDNIGHLFRLKYLSLKNTSLSELPGKTVELEYLETLNLKGNNISQLPESIVRLQCLVCLLTDAKVRLPDGIGKMQALQELKLISVMEQPRNFVKELGQLTNLKELSLSLESSDTVDAGTFEECTKTMVSSICNLGRLHSLSICIGTGCDDGFLQESWSPPPSSLGRFVIKKETPISRVPNWMGSSLVNLQQLYLRLKALNHDDVCILGGIPALDHLVLHIQQREEVVAGCPNGRLDISSSQGFSVLRYLKIDGVDPRSLGLNFQVGSMPMLEEIVLMFRAVETPDLTRDGFGFGMEHLEKLAIVNCEIDCYPQPKSNEGVQVEEQGPQVVSEEATQVADSLPQAAVKEDAAVEPTSQVEEDEAVKVEKAAGVLETAIRRAVTGHPNQPRLIIRKIKGIPGINTFVLMLFVALNQLRSCPESSRPMVLGIIIIALTGLLFATLQGAIS